MRRDVIITIVSGSIGILLFDFLFNGFITIDDINTVWFFACGVVTGWYNIRRSP